MDIALTSYEQAMLDVIKRVTASKSSFTAGMVILPRDRKEAMFALYAFCREVDDIADEGLNEKSRRDGLNLWRQKIAALFEKGQASDTICTALLPAIKKYDLLQEDFQAIIDGMEMDAGEPICAPDSATLDLYCDRVASAVGRASVRIFGDASAQAMTLAHHLGRALQLTNILRDLAEDAQRGRLYMPCELLAKHGVVYSTPSDILDQPTLKNACRDLATLAALHFKMADEAMALCNKRAVKPAKIMRDYYGAIHKKLVASDWVNPRLRLRLSGAEKAWLLIKNLAFPFL